MESKLENKGKEGQKGAIRYRKWISINGPEISMTPKNCYSKKSSKTIESTRGFN